MEISWNVNVTWAISILHERIQISLIVYHRRALLFPCKLTIFTAFFSIAYTTQIKMAAHRSQNSTCWSSAYFTDADTELCLLFIKRHAPYALDVYAHRTRKTEVIIYSYVMDRFYVTNGYQRRKKTIFRTHITFVLIPSLNKIFSRSQLCENFFNHGSYNFLCWQHVAKRHRKWNFKKNESSEYWRSLHCEVVVARYLPVILNALQDTLHSEIAGLQHWNMIQIAN